MSLRLGFRVGIGTGFIPQSDAVFTVRPEIVEYIPPATLGLTVATGNETLDITGFAGYPTTVTPGQETLAMEIAFP